MEQINQLRNQLKRVRIVAFVVCIFCGLFLIYAYVQKLEADRNLFMAQRAQAEADKQRMVAEHQRAIAMQEMKTAMSNHEAAQK